MISIFPSVLCKSHARVCGQLGQVGEVQTLLQQEALLLQRDRATLLSVQILLTHDGGIYRA